MKNFKSILTIALIVGGVIALNNGCKDNDILDVKPGFLTEESYFQDESEFDRSVRGIYAKLTDLYWFRNNDPIVGIWQLPGDDITTLGDVPQEIFATLNSGNGWLNGYYKSLYEMINRANVVLEKNADSKVYTSETTKKAHRGEALFLRGFAYYRLWNTFGTSPIALERVKSTDKTTPGSSKGTELLDQAIKDAQEAATLLPEKWDDLNRGRATQNSANALLAKSLVFRGSWNKTQADYTAAITAVNNIKNATLVANFEDNFNPDTENNTESMFEFQASQPGFDNVWLSNDFGAPVGSMSAYWGYYENHWSLFGKPKYEATAKLINAFEDGDARKAITLKADGNIVKYVNKDRKSQSGVASINNPRIFRYADMLLLKAEALAQSGGSLSEAIALVNQVRARARNMSTAKTIPADRPSSTDRAQVMQWIMAERMVELAGEESRWFDLRRWHQGGTIVLNSAFFDSKNSKMLFDANTHLFAPIPNNEIDLNPNVTQNPGY